MHAKQWKSQRLLPLAAAFLVTTLCPVGMTGHVHGEPLPDPVRLRELEHTTDSRSVLEAAVEQANQILVPPM